MMRARAVAAVVVLGTVVAACSVEGALPAPSCDGGSSLIAAQSVPSATQIPCLERLPDGWIITAVSIDQDRSIVHFDSDRAGDDAATLRLDTDCDTSGAVSATSDLSGADRYDQIDQLEPFRASRYYVFPGGCVSWRFEFDRDASATESVAIGDALRLVTRQTFNDSIRKTFIDEDI